MKIGFIGLGQVARTFATVLCGNNNEEAPKVFGFDSLLAEKHEIFEKRFQGLPLRFCGSLKELIENCDIVLSTVTTSSAIKVACEAVRYLNKDQYYVDMNSMSPNRKMEAAALMEGKTNFIEAAILGAVGATGGKTKILVSGAFAPQIEEILCKFGLNVSAFGAKIGGASQFKMIRSVFSKGLETLVIEMMQAGVKAGICEEVWDDIVSFMNQMPFDKICENWIKSHPRAAERRYYEMEQVVETLEELGAASSMAKGSMQVFKTSMDKKVYERFPDEPEDYRDIISFLAK